MDKKIYDEMYSKISLLPLKGKLVINYPKIIRPKIHFVNLASIFFGGLSLLFELTKFFVNLSQEKDYSYDVYAIGIDFTRLIIYSLIWFIGKQYEQVHPYLISVIPLIFSVCATEKNILLGKKNEALFEILSKLSLSSLSPIFLPMNFLYCMIFPVLNLMYPLFRCVEFSSYSLNLFLNALFGFCLCMYYCREAFTSNICRFYTSQIFHKQWKNMMLNLPVGITRI